MTSSVLKIVRDFDEAAGSYDGEAPLQAQVAVQLVCKASGSLTNPESILDIGTGTGLVAVALREKWPNTELTAIDTSPRMLRLAEQKVEHLRTIRGDATTMELTRKFDAIFSSMMLHWLPDPADVLMRWQRWLKPNGKMFVALLTEGSFQEWRDLCRIYNVTDGLWKMPKPNFADILMPHSEQQAITITYPSAQAFLHRLKATGAATPHDNHEPIATIDMRRLLQGAAKPFPATYQVLYIGNSLQGNV